MNVLPIKVINKKIVYVENNQPAIIIDDDNKECQLQQVGVDLRIKEELVLNPGESKNIEILERFSMGPYFGTLHIRSSLSRKLIHMSCGLFDPFFNGVGSVSLYNWGKEILKLAPGTRICQIVVHPAKFTKKYEGFYKKNKTIISQYGGDK